MTVTKDSLVTISYTYTKPDGDVLGSSEHSGPLAFVPGRGRTLPGLETRILGAVVGEDFVYEIPAREAFGERNEDRVFRVSPDQIASETKLEPGMKVAAETDGGSVELSVVSVDEREIVLDANHPLAGHDIVFRGRIESIADADTDGCSGGCCSGCAGSCGP